jgi:hypothetical protein
MEGMSEREVATLKDLLKRVYRNLEAADRNASERPAARVRPAKKDVKRRVKVSGISTCETI